VSVRMGARSDTSSSQYAKLRGRLERRLHVEDPCDASRNLRDVLRWENEQQLMEYIWMTACQLQPGALVPMKQYRQGSRRSKGGPNDMQVLPMLLPGMHGMAQYMFAQQMQPNMRDAQRAGKRRKRPVPSTREYRKATTTPAT